MLCPTSALLGLAIYMISLVPTEQVRLNLLNARVYVLEHADFASRPQSETRPFALLR